MRVLFTCALVLIVCSCDASEAEQVSARRECNVTAMLLGQDNVPTSIFAASLAGSKILGEVPPSLENDNYRVGPEIRIISSKDNWNKIEVLGDISSITGVPNRSMYQGEGWVKSPQVMLNVESDKVFQNPDTNSKVEFSFDDLSLQGFQPISTVVNDCTGNWVSVDMVFQSQKALEKHISKTGWVNGICKSLDTSCENELSH